MKTERRIYYVDTDGFFGFDPKNPTVCSVTVVRETKLYYFVDDAVLFFHCASRISRDHWWIAFSERGAWKKLADYQAKRVGELQRAAHRAQRLFEIAEKHLQGKGE